MPRRLALLLAAIAVAVLIIFLPRRAPAPTAPSAVPSPAPSLPSATATAPPAIKVAATTATEPEEISAAINLNAPGGTIGGDLEMLNTVFTDWRLNFPRIGNPWGENVEITTMLTTPTVRGASHFPRTHPAINSAGELCDRWGTPFHFHAISGTRMEIRSAGPDKKFGTADDAVLTPP